MCECVWKGWAEGSNSAFPSFFSVGQVVNIRAKVNRAFNTSMEVSELHAAVSFVVFEIRHESIA